LLGLQETEIMLIKNYYIIFIALRFISLTTLLSALIAADAYAQSTIIEAEEGSFVGDYKSYVPDPNSPISIAIFATDDAVANEIELSVEKRESLRLLIKDSGGNLSVIMLSRWQNGVQLEPAEVTALAVARRDRNLVEVMSIFTPDQLLRLSQIVRQIEIQRVGLREALVYGHFGQAADVKDYQRPALLISAEVIEKRFTAAMVELTKKVDKRIAESLEPEQQKTLPELIGEPFVYAEKSNMGHLSWTSPSQTGTVRQFSIPDPESPSQLVSLLLNESIKKELRITNDELSEVVDRLKISNGSLMNPQIPAKINGRRTTKEERAKYREESLKDNDEVAFRAIDPIQLDRLKQIAYRVEIARLGLSNAFIYGRLGVKLGITSSQHQVIRTASDEAEADFKRSMIELMDQTYADAIALLDPVQRPAARQAIGKAFLYESKHWKTEKYLKH
jgi:hypothetical protein